MFLKNKKTMVTIVQLTLHFSSFFNISNKIVNNNSSMIFALVNPCAKNEFTEI